MALPGTAPLPVDVAIEGVQVCARRRRASPSTSTALAAGASRATRSSTWSACPARAHETEVFFSDLGHEYVTINAEYTT